VKISGKILNERYTRLLMERTELGLSTIMLLDKVQKRHQITHDEHRQLKADKLVEGRYPNLVISAILASVTGQKAQHIRDRGFDNKYYQDLIIKLIREHQPVSREDIDRLILDKLPEVLTHKQKEIKIHNLLIHLAGKEKRIRNVGSKKYPRWVLNITNLKIE